MEFKRIIKFTLSLLMIVLIVSATVHADETTYNNTLTSAEIPNYTTIDIENMNEDGEVYFRYNDDRTQVTSISGKYSEIIVNNTDDALSAVQGIRTITGLSNAYEELKLFYTNSHEYGSVYKYNQVFNGYTVYGHSLVVTTDKNGITNSFSSSIVPTSKLMEMNTSIGLTQSEAEKIAQQYVGIFSKVFEDETELIIYTLEEEDLPIFVYEVTVGKVRSADSYTVFINNDNGDIIDSESNLIYSKSNSINAVFLYPFVLLIVIILIVIFIHKKKNIKVNETNDYSAEFLENK